MEKVVETDRNWTNVAHRLIGKGGEGEAYLAIRYDNQAHRIVDRFVSKHVHKGCLDVRDPWWVKDDSPPAYLPMEIMAMKQFASTALPRCPHIVALRGWNVDLRDYSDPHYIVHMEVCPYGDLSSVTQLFAEMADKMQDDEDGDAIAHIPEPALWYFLEALCDAGLTMEHGACNGGSAASWEKVLHRDIKPKNIFFSEPSNSYPHYPTPKLGDWGLSLFETDADPQDFYCEGTESYLAPEQVVNGPIGDDDSSDDDTEHGSDLKRRQAELDGQDTEMIDSFMETDSIASDDSWIPIGEAADTGIPIWLNSKGALKRPKLTMATNVFNVGICIMNMMNQHDMATAPLDWESALNDGTPEFSDAAKAKYSKALLRTVRACVRYRPNDRCTFTALKTRINRYTAGPQRIGFANKPYKFKYDRAEGMRTNKTPMDRNNGHDIGTFKDWWKMGAMFDPDVFEAGATLGDGN